MSGKFNPCRPCCTPCGHRVAVGIYWSGNSCSKRDTPIGGLGPRIVRVSDGEVISPGGLGKTTSFVSEVGEDYDITVIEPGLPPPPPSPNYTVCAGLLPYMPYEAGTLFGISNDPIWCVKGGDSVRYTGKCLKQNQIDLVKLYADHTPGCFNIEKKDYTLKYYYDTLKLSGNPTPQPGYCCLTQICIPYKYDNVDLEQKTKEYTLKFIDTGASPGFCGYWCASGVDDFVRDAYSKGTCFGQSSDLFGDCAYHSWDCNFGSVLVSQCRDMVVYWYGGCGIAGSYYANSTEVSQRDCGRQYVPTKCVQPNPLDIAPAILGGLLGPAQVYTINPLYVRIGSPAASLSKWNKDSLNRCCGGYFNGYMYAIPGTNSFYCNSFSTVPIECYSINIYMITIS